MAEDQPPLERAAAELVFDGVDEAATAALAGRLAPLLRRGDVLALTGDLGVGKTAFARALLRAMGHKGDVPSPTFTLVQIYEFESSPVWHFDFYRIAAPEEAYETGIEAAFAEAIAIIEWPDKVAALLPAERIDLRFDFTERDDARRICMTVPDTMAARFACLAQEPV